MKELTTPDSPNTPSTTNPEEEETVDAPGNDGNALMPEQAKQPNPWRKMMKMTMVQKLKGMTGRHTGTAINVGSNIIA